MIKETTMLTKQNWHGTLHTKKKYSMLRLTRFMASCYNETRNHVKETGITVIHQYNTPAKKVKYGIITADSEIIDLS